MKSVDKPLCSDKADVPTCQPQLREQATGG
jgi:hypothetical protein